MESSSTTEQEQKTAEMKNLEKESIEQEKTSDKITETKAFVRSPLARDNKSLKWHDAPLASSRALVSPSQPHELLLEGPSFVEKKEVVAVFNANTVQGGSMVRALGKRGSSVIAIVRVFTSQKTKALLKLNNVVVKVADSHDEAALSKAVEGANRAFLVTKYWERFENFVEEKQAMIVVEACSQKNVHHLVLSSFEDTKHLREKGLKSQIIPKRDGTIQPTFEGMQPLKELARQRNVQLTHMITSYVDQVRMRVSKMPFVCVILVCSRLLLYVGGIEKVALSHCGRKWKCHYSTSHIGRIRGDFSDHTLFWERHAKQINLS